MDTKRFQDWLAGIDNLSGAQRAEAVGVLSGQPDDVLSLVAVEATVEEDRRCQHCDTPGAISRGKARGLRRYQCKGCRRTFNAATGTPLSGASPQGALADIRRIVGAERDGTGIGPPVRAWGQYGIPLAAPVPGERRAGPPEAQGYCRG